MKPPPQPPPEGELELPEEESIQRKTERTKTAGRGCGETEAKENQPEPEEEEDEKKEKYSGGRGVASDRSQTQGSQDSIVSETPPSPDWDTKWGENEKDEDAWSKRGSRPEQEQSGDEQAPSRPTRGRAQSPVSAAPKPNIPGQKEMPSRRAAAEEAVEPEIQPSEIFEALVTAIKAAPDDPPREAWMTTIAELYAAAHDTVKVEQDLVPAGKRRYPKLKGEEKAQLFKLFKALCVTAGGSFALWEQQAVVATRNLYNTNWTFKTIMQSMISKAEWATTPPLNQWAAKVKGRPAQTEATEARPGTSDRYQDFMFNPATYKAEEIAAMRTLCEQPQDTRSGWRLRAGTEAEWAIIDGIVTGSIVCRRLPSFFNSVLDSKEQMRFTSTIQSQVEGELQLQLRSRVYVNANRQITQTLKDDILLAAEKLKMNSPDLRQMLNQAKTISYNHVRRSIHFYFFDRQTACRYQQLQVPFDRTLYRLINAHAPDTGSVWERQRARDGTRIVPRPEYEVEIHNVTRFTDVGRLAAYLQKHIDVDVAMADMDTCTPDSRTSTVWNMIVKTAECPEYLRGIVRIVWFGRTLILKHPHMRQRLQCLRCGNLGHPMARCRYTDAQLKGAGSRVASEQEVAQLEDLARPFVSLEEIQRSAAERLSLQAAEEKRAAGAVDPATEDQRHGRVKEEVQEKQAPETPQPAQDRQAADGSVPPEPKKQWVTVQMRHGRTLYAHPAALHQKLQSRGSRFAELVDDNEAADDGAEPAKGTSPTQDAISISSGGEQEDTRQHSITEEENKKHLHLVQAKPHKLHQPFQLVALKQRESTVLEGILADRAADRGRLRLPPVMTVETVEDFTGVEKMLEMREVNTPPSGNCMAMAIAQALSDTDLAGDDQTLEQMTRSLKRGLRWTAQLNINEQFSHFVRKTTLVNLRRGWDAMEPHESMKQFKWYLDEYATSPSGREDFVPRHNWGCSEMMAAAANFLHRVIYVMAFDTDDKQLWYCSKYRPATASRGRLSFDRGEQIPLQLARCLAEIRKEKKRGNQPPLVLRYWGEHYSAFTHNREPAEDVAPGKQPHVKSPAREQPGGPDSQDEQIALSDQGANMNAWSPEMWHGDVADLREKLTGMAIPHDLQCEIHLILENAETERYTELLGFLVNTAAQLSTAERVTLMQADLRTEPIQQVRQLMQKYQLSGEALKQWQLETERMQKEEKEMQISPGNSGVSSEGSAYAPSSATSSQASAASKATITRSTETQPIQSKRPHSITPIEGENIRQYAKSRLGRHSEEDEVEAMQDEQRMETTEESGDTRDAWPELWRKLGSLWPATATAPFPNDRSTEVEWAVTARTEPTKLLKMVQRFSYPEEVLVAISEKVMEQWITVWRKECLHDRLAAYRSRTDDKQTRRWLDDWKAKMEGQNLPAQIQAADSSDDWTQLRSRGYGKDEVLRFCDVGNKTRLAHHLLCALIYEKEIRVLTGREDEKDSGPVTRLERHLSALKSVKPYGDVYAGHQRSEDWYAIARYFATALECGAKGRNQ